MLAIKAESISKSFGNTQAVKEISFVVRKGEMFGLVGPDGAGKSTTIRMFCGLLLPDNGSVSIFEQPLLSNKKEIQNRIGYLSQKFSLYGDLSIDENIEYFAQIHNVKDFSARRDELLEFTRLKPFRKRTAERLSGGMKQKLALACSLIHKPEIIFLDEPTTGVDPVSRRDFWKILSELLNSGITIFMSTPYLDEAERCNHVALMHQGEIMKLDTPQNLKLSIEKKTFEIVCNDVDKAAKIINEKFTLDVQTFGDRINIILKPDDLLQHKIVEELKNSKIDIHNIRTIPPSLENVFIYLINNVAN